MTENMNKDKNLSTKKKKERKAGKNLRNGGYSMGLTAIVLVILIVVNVIVESLPANLRMFDISPTQLFTLSDTTKDVISRMKTPVTIFTIAEPGNENSYMQAYVQLYQAESDMITLDSINPATDIELMDEYTLNNAVEGSVLVVGDHYVCDNCGYESEEELELCPECEEEDARFVRKHRYVNINNTFTTETDETTGDESASAIDMEGQLTSALVYVSTSDTQEVYYFTGHGEEATIAPSEGFIAEVEKLNMGFNIYNFAKYKTIPNDADVIILNGPDDDYTDEETEELLQYVENGGSLLILLRFNNSTDFYMPNFEKILASYGIKMSGGGVLESNSAYYYDNAVYSIKPSIHKHDITQSLIDNDQDLIVYLADALKVIDEYDNENVTISPLITTSSSAYLKKRGASSMRKAEGDETGTYNLGVAIEEKQEETSGRIVVLSTHYLLSDSIADSVNGANTDLIVNSVSWLGHQSEMTRVGMKSLSPSNLTPTTSDMFRVTIIVAIIVPSAFLLAGVIIWYRRRKH